MKTAALTFLISVFGLCAFSQDPSPYKGRVTSANSPVPGATIALLKVADSSLVKLSLSGNDGHFEFTAIPNGSYLYLVTSVGFDSLYAKAVENEPAELQLKQSSHALTSVTV